MDTRKSKAAFYRYERSEQTKAASLAINCVGNLELHPLEDKGMTHDNELTSAVIGAAIEVHRQLGPGLLESIYQKSLEIEFRLREIGAISQSRVPLQYKGFPLGDDLVMDFHFPDQLVVEIKSVSQLAPVHTAQVLSYMKLSRSPLGLLINFNVPVLKDGINRLAL